MHCHFIFSMLSHSQFIYDNIYICGVVVAVTLMLFCQQGKPCWLLWYTLAFHWGCESGCIRASIHGTVVEKFRGLALRI